MQAASSNTYISKRMLDQYSQARAKKIEKAQQPTVQLGSKAFAEDDVKEELKLIKTQIDDLHLVLLDEGLINENKEDIIENLQKGGLDMNSNSIK